MPGLCSYQKLLPYSGTDLNHHLNPLPRFEREQAYSTQRKFLDREVNKNLYFKQLHIENFLYMMFRLFIGRDKRPHDMEKVSQSRSNFFI
jgi:hypothetical protein